MNKTLILLVIATEGLMAAGCSRSGIPASEAKNHIGERETVYGKVFGSKLTRAGTALLDVGGAYVIVGNSGYEIFEGIPKSKKPKLKLKSKRSPASSHGNSPSAES
jgi:hypothetical protein